MNINFTRKSIITSLFFTLFLFCSNRLNASHEYGGEITYKLIDTTLGTYQFTLTKYRYCEGLSNSPLSLNIASSQFYVQVPLTLLSSETVEVTPLCSPPDVVSKTITNCPGPNISPPPPHFIKGIMKEVYTCNYIVGRNIGMVLASFNECCRSILTTIAPSSTLYIQTTFNTNYLNNSIVFQNEHFPRWCKGRENTYSIMVSDVFDPKYIVINGKNVIRDSISYFRYRPWENAATSVALAIQMQNNPLTYVPGLNEQNFLFTTNGVSMNPYTGVIKATPDRDQEAVLAVGVQEWRAIPNGSGGYTRELVSTVVRDIQLSVTGNCDPVVENGIIQDSIYGVTKTGDNKVEICGVQAGKIVFKLEGLPNRIMRLVENPTNTYSKQNFVNYSFKTHKVVVGNTETHYGTITFDSVKGSGLDRLLFTYYSCNPAGIKESYDYGIEIRYKPSMTLDKRNVSYCQGSKPVRIKSTSAKKVSWTPITGIVAAGPDSVWIEIAPSVATTYTAKGLDLDTTNVCSIISSVFVDYKPSMSYNLSSKSKSVCFMDSCLIDLSFPGVDTPYTIKWINSEDLLFDRTSKRIANNIFNPITYGIKNKMFLFEITNAFGCIVEDTFNLQVNGMVPSAKIIPNRSSFCIGDTTAVEVKISPKFSGPSLFKNNSQTGTINLTSGNITYPSASCNGNGCYPHIYGTTSLGKSSSTRILYTKAQLQSAGAKPGIIKSIAFNISQVNVTDFSGFSIKMGSTSATSSLVTVPLFSVYSNKSIQVSSGWNTYLFDAPFDWDGESNLLVEICVSRNNATTLLNRYVTNSLPSGSEVSYKVSNTENVDACSLSSTFIASGGSQAKPHSRFSMTGIDSSDSQLNYTWSPITAVLSQNKTKAILKTSAKYTFFDLKVGNSACYDSNRLQINFDTNFSVSLFGSRTICRSSGSSSPFQIGAKVKNNGAYTVSWTSIPNDPTMSSTTTDTIFINPTSKGLHKYVITVSSSPCQYIDTVFVNIQDTISFSMTKIDPTCNQNNGSIVSLLSMGNDSSDYNYKWTPNISSFTKLYNISAGSYSLQLTLKSDTTCKGQQNINLIQNPILITKQPNKINKLCIGDSKKLIVKALYQDSIQWYKNGVPILGAINDTLSIANVSINDTGKYYALIYGCPTNKYSDTSIIQAFPTATISQDPKDTTLCEGNILNLAVVSNNADSIVWYKDGIRKIKSSSYNIASTILSDSGAYYAIAYSGGTCLSDTSTKAKVIIIPTPKITVQPRPLSKIILGGNRTLSVTATNVASYQWFKDGVAIPGATMNNYQIINFDSTLHKGTYTCRLTPFSPCSNILISSDAIVKPTFCDTSVKATITKSGNTLVATIVNGEAPFSYAWSNNIFVSSIDVNKPGSYCVTITDANGCTASNCIFNLTPNPTVPCNVDAKFGFSYNNSGDVQFSDSSTANGLGMTYFWNFGDGTFSSQKNPLKSYAQLGNYNVTLYVTSWINSNNQYCIDTISRMVNVVNVNPCNAFIPNFIWNQNGLSYTFTNTSFLTGYTIQSIQWQFSDGTTTTLSSPIKTFSISGTKVITLTMVVKNNQTQTICTKTVTKSLYVNTNLCASHNAFNSVSVTGKIASFSNFSSGTNASTTYLYKFGNGDSSNLPSPVYTYPLPGLYRTVMYVKTTFNSVSCEDSFVRIIQISTSNLCKDSGYTAYYDYLCPEYEGPVCGCDSITYKNYCKASTAGVKQYSYGPCPNDTAYVTICGYVVNDMNRNCQKDASDIAIPSVKITINTIPPTIVYTNAMGYFTTVVKKGTYTLTQSLNSNTNPFAYKQICPAAGISVTATNGGQVYCNNNFYDTANTCQDIATSIFRQSNITPGFTSIKQIKYQNNGATAVANAVLHYRFLNSLSIKTTTSSPYTVSGNVISWNIGTIPAYSSGYRSAHFLTPVTLPLGTKVLDSAWIEPMTGDCNMANNSATFMDICVGSYDPNDKTAYPAGNTDTSVKIIDYLVRFQNTGTAPAHNVVIVDSIENNLDFSTLTLHSTSHTPCRIFTNDNKKVYFEFENIMLPDSGSDYEGSQGYVNFSLKLKENLPVGTQIKNTAAIYFDFNEPVITNTTVNTIYLKSSSGIISKEKDYTVELYPNPTKGEKVTLKVTSDKMQTISYRIFDLNGREKMIQADRKANGYYEKEIQLNSLSKGIYLIDISINGEASGKIKLVKE